VFKARHAYSSIRIPECFPLSVGPWELFGMIPASVGMDWHGIISASDFG